MKTIVKFGLAALTVTIVLTAWGGISSVRYGYQPKEYKLMESLEAARDVEGLNRLLVQTHSAETKGFVLLALRRFDDPSSARPVVKHLGFGLPFWAKLDEDNPEDSDVRIEAFSTAFELGPIVLRQLRRRVLFSTADLYETALRAAFGDIAAKRRLLRYGTKSWAREDYRLLTKRFHKMGLSVPTGEDR